MEYRISSIKNFILIEVIGPFNRKAIYSAGAFLRQFLKPDDQNIILDIDALEDEKEMVFHVGLVNAFKKEIDQAGGKLIISTEKPAIRKYFQSNRLDKIFNLVGPQFLMEIN